ncbi:MAG: TIGR01777 family protein [Chthoniobacterales bacterium]|nr:MAG: TIGR01777 family protein [Chthoniobacterales bacterium]
MKARVVIAGGTGFIGRTLAPFLASSGYDVVVLTRGSERDGAIRHAYWNGESAGEWISEIDGATAIVNLAGRSINCRHTPAHQREIIVSRVESIRALAAAMTQCAKPPRLFVQAAGIGIYGDTGERICDESAPAGGDFLAEICQRWEAAFEWVNASSGTRKVLLRIGVVLGRGGGFLDLLGKLTRLFLGGHVGNECQFISWIHERDLCRIVLHALVHEEIRGSFNATAPEPVTNAEFMRELRRALHRPWTPPLPALAARLGGWLLGTEGSLALVSQRCVPKRLLDAGFVFSFPTLASALAEIYPTS